MKKSVKKVFWWIGILLVLVGGLVHFLQGAFALNLLNILMQEGIKRTVQTIVGLATVILSGYLITK